MIKNIILDFGKVLVDYDFDALFERIMPDNDRRMGACAIINDPEFIKRVDRGDKCFGDAIEDLIELHPDYEHELRVFLEHKPEVVTGEVPGMRDLLLRLKEEGYKIYGLTNWDSQIYITMKQFEIFNLLDGYLISSEEHLIKPEAEVYQRLFKKFCFVPSECVFTDDRAINVEGARVQGMEAIVFESTAQYEKELRSIIERNR